MTNLLEMSQFEGFHWFNKPLDYSLTDTGISIKTNSKTDFWQRTHYDFQKDDGHCLLKTISGDFSIVIQSRFHPEDQYDQCGLFARINNENWIKCSTEFESNQLSRLGSVVTNLGYSDWASQDINSPVTTMWYRLSRSGKDFLIENSFDGKQWLQMRITHLHCLKEKIDVGLYACSPVGEGFECSFEFLEIGPNSWLTK
jgi:uncharacterized protein